MALVDQVLILGKSIVVIAEGFESDDLKSTVQLLLKGKDWRGGRDVHRHQRLGPKLQKTFEYS